MSRVIERRRMFRRLGRLYISVVLLLMLFAAYYVGFSILASSKEQSVNEAWAKTLGGPFDPIAKFPKTTKNASAQMIEDMTNPDKSQFGLKRPLQQPAWEGGWKVLDNELDKSADQPVTLPSEVKDFLNAHQKQFSAVYNQIRKEGPVWDQDLSKGSLAPIANVSAMMAISRLIALDALNKKQSGQTAAAREASDAALKIDATMHNRPGTVYLIAASNLDDIQSRLLRRLGDSQGKSQEKVQSADNAKTAEWSVAISAERFSQLMNDSPNLVSMFNYKFSLYFGKDSSKIGSVLTTLVRPYLRVCAADTSESLRRGVEELKAGKTVNDHTAWWNRPGKNWGIDLKIIEKSLNQAQTRTGKD
jgi:hypothetical protein